MHHLDNWMPDQVHSLGEAGFGAEFDSGGIAAGAIRAKLPAETRPQGRCCRGVDPPSYA